MQTLRSGETHQIESEVSLSAQEDLTELARVIRKVYTASLLSSCAHPLPSLMLSCSLSVLELTL